MTGVEILAIVAFVALFGLFVVLPTVMKKRKESVEME